MINSAFRSKQVNDAVGSKDTSQHRIGCAADMRVPGMTPDEVSAAQSPLAGWVQDTMKGKPVFSLGDPHELFSIAKGPAAPRRWSDDRWSAKGDAQALGALGLDRAASPADVRRAYRRLVRRYHPDSNGGDRSSEGKLQAVVNAFTHLKSAAGYKMESNSK
jgi:hypothetical protein